MAARDRFGRRRMIASYASLIRRTSAAAGAGRLRTPVLEAVG
jgi:hypothetical protein